MFKVNNKDTRMTPMAPRTSSVCIINFEHVNAGWETQTAGRLRDSNSIKTYLNDVDDVILNGSISV